jgi:hypothetical protein
MSTGTQWSERKKHGRKGAEGEEKKRKGKRKQAVGPASREQARDRGPRGNAYKRVAVQGGRQADGKTASTHGPPVQMYVAVSAG